MKSIIILFLSFTMIACEHIIDNTNKEAVAKPITEIKTAIDTSNWKTLEKDNFKIKYPNDWEISSNILESTTAFMIVSPVDSSVSSKALVSLSILNAIKDSSIDFYVRGIEESYKRDFTNSIIKESKRVRVNNIDYYMMVVTFDKLNIHVEDEKWFRIVGNKVYVTHFVSNEKIFNKYKSIGEAMLCSFALKN